MFRKYRGKMCARKVVLGFPLTVMDPFSGIYKLTLNTAGLITIRIESPY